MTLYAQAYNSEYYPKSMYAGLQAVTLPAEEDEGPALTQSAMHESWLRDFCNNNFPQKEKICDASLVRVVTRTLQICLDSSQILDSFGVFTEDDASESTHFVLNVQEAS